MDIFEFILTITSVIYALAVAQILSGISRIAQSETRVVAFFPHSIWVFNLFVFIFLVWWAHWEFRDTTWTFPQYAYMLIAPTLLFFACSLLIPQQLRDGTVSLEEHFFRIRRPLFLSFFFAALVVIIDGNLLADEPLWYDARIGQIALLGLALYAYFTKKIVAHKAIAVLTSVTIAALVAMRFWNPPGQ